jgi:hypothetical protein
MKSDATAGVKDFVYIAVAVAAIGGLLFGYDTGVISGAILFVKTQFSLSPGMEEIVVSAVLVGAVIGAVLGGALTDRFGRRVLIILAGIIFTASAIGTALASTVTWLIAARAAEWNSDRHRFLYLTDVHRRVGAGKSPRLAGGSQHACDYHRHRCRLSGGLCTVRHPGLAIHVWLGGYSIHHSDCCNVVVTGQPALVDRQV